MPALTLPSRSARSPLTITETLIAKTSTLKAPAATIPKFPPAAIE